MGNVGKTSFWLINQALLLLACVLTALVIYRVAEVSVGRNDLIPPPPQASALYTAHEPQAFQSQDFYTKAAHRNLFRPVTVTKPRDDTPKEMSECREILERIQQTMQVMGIGWMPPKTVMLFDKQQRQTYFVRESQPIADTGVEVRAISKDAITIGCNEEELDLFRR